MVSFSRLFAFTHFQQKCIWSHSISTTLLSSFHLSAHSRQKIFIQFTFRFYSLLREGAKNSVRTVCFNEIPFDSFSSSLNPFELLSSECKNTVIVVNIVSCTEIHRTCWRLWILCICICICTSFTHLRHGCNHVSFFFCVWMCICHILFSKWFLFTSYHISFPTTDI